MVSTKEKFELLNSELLSSHKLNLNHSFNNFWSFIENTAEINILFKKLEDKLEDSEVLHDDNIDRFLHEFKKQYRKILHREFQSDEEKILFHFKILSKIFFSEKDFYRDYFFHLARSGNNKDNKEERSSFLLKDALKFFIDPIFNYVHLNLIETNNFMYLIGKYKKKKEWFFRKSFFDLYVENERSEDFLDLDLREFLFDEGIEFPFSTTKIPSGRPDIVANLETKSPLIMEVKILDKEKKYSKSRIIGGFTQAYNYAIDYQKNIGFLVVFNADEFDKKVIINGNDNLPSSITIGEVKIYAFIININPEGVVASKQGEIKSISITKDEIIKDIESLPKL